MRRVFFTVSWLRVQTGLRPCRLDRLAMKKTFLNLRALPVLLMAALSCSCTLLDRDRRNTNLNPRGYHKPVADGPGGGPVKDTVLYALGVEYPYEYDWRADPDFGNAKCRLVVFEAQKRKIVADAGPGTLISPDPDRNRIIGGHLYSDFSSGGRTYISRDGELLFDYGAAETMAGLMVREGDVYTLGENRRGEGFSFRKNGSELFSSRNGHVAGSIYSGALYEDCDEICFVYYTDSGKERNYYTYSDSGPEPLVCPHVMASVLAVRRINGVMYMAGVSQTSKGNPVIYSGGDLVACEAKNVQNTRNCRFIVSGDEVYLAGDIVLLGHRGSERCLWDSEGTLLSHSSDIYEFYVHEGTVAYPVTDRKGYVSELNVDGTVYVMEDSLKIYSSFCAGFSDGRFYTAMVPLQRERSPFVWKNGRALAYTLNGYTIGVYGGE